MGRMRFFTRRGALVAVAILAALAMARRTPAQDITFGVYDEFTLYNADEGPLKDDILFVFHGFASAMPNGAYERLHRALSEHFSVIGFNYDYFDLDTNDATMDVVWNRLLADRNVVFAGTSLGGFWANYYAEKYGVNRVAVVNPVVDPVRQLRQFIGEQYVAKRRKTLVVTAADIDRYSGRARAAKPGIDRLVILSRDDRILDYRLAQEKFRGPGNTVITFATGGHSVDLEEARYLDPLRAFLTPRD